MEEFLEADVEKGLTESDDITSALTDEANAIMDEVSDIIGLTKLDDTLVQESIADAKTKHDHTVEALTDVNFPADKWSGIASNSNLGMAIAAQQAPVGSVAYALHQ